MSEWVSHSQLHLIAGKVTKRGINDEICLYVYVCVCFFPFFFFFFLAEWGVMTEERSCSRVRGVVRDGMSIARRRARSTLKDTKSSDGGDCLFLETVL